MRSLLITLLLITTLPSIAMMICVDENPFDATYTGDDAFYSISLDDDPYPTIDQSYKYCDEMDTEQTEED